MKRILAASLIALAATPALAIQVEFQVPVDVKNIDPAATHVEVTCGSWGDNRSFLNYKKATVPLRDERTHKSYQGTVTIKVDWPGTTVPTGRYRCAMGMIGKNLGPSGEFTSRPAAVGTRATTSVEGSFQEMQGLPRPQMKQAPTKPALQR